VIAIFVLRVWPRPLPSMSFPIHYLPHDAAVLDKGAYIPYDGALCLWVLWVWALLHYVLLAPGILTWIGEFWGICAPLVWASENIVQLTVSDRTLVLLWCSTEAK